MCILDYIAWQKSGIASRRQGAPVALRKGNGGILMAEGQRERSDDGKLPCGSLCRSMNVSRALSHADAARRVDKSVPDVEKASVKVLHEGAKISRSSQAILRELDNLKGFNTEERMAYADPVMCGRNFPPVCGRKPSQCVTCV